MFIDESQQFIVTVKIFHLLGDNFPDGLLDAAVEEFRLSRGVKITVQVGRVVENLDIIFFCRFPYQTIRLNIFWIS